MTGRWIQIGAGTFSVVTSFVPPYSAINPAMCVLGFVLIIGGILTR